MLLISSSFFKPENLRYPVEISLETNTALFTSIVFSPKYNPCMHEASEEEKKTEFSASL